MTQTETPPNNFIILPIPPVNDSKELEFSSITLNSEYAQKWNASYLKDYILLTKNGVPLRNTLYRIGGMGTPNLGKDDYFLLLKYVEAHYPDSITKITKDKPHLESRWCIMDKYGNERVEFKQFDSPYLVKDSLIYSLNQDYYNIETGEFYGHSHTTMQSAEYVFLGRGYDKDASKRGVMKIHKKTGSWELFPEK